MRMEKLTNECKVGEVSDSYHTFNELCEHRLALFVCLMKSNPEMSWRANNNHDGSSYEGWFIAGMSLPCGDISYRLPSRLWTTLDNAGIATSNRAPQCDGHSSNDVIHRLEQWASSIKKVGTKYKPARPKGVTGLY